MKRVSLSRRGRVMARSVIWVAALLPAAWIVFQLARDELGANPIEEVMDRLGWWGLTLLTATLAISPLRKLTGWHWLVRFRRLIGLFAFFYICLHLATYVVLDQWFALDVILEDIAKRPFITVGFAAWLILLALALTSTRAAIRRLGRRWQRLHRLIYVAACLGALHFFWNVKADTREPLVFVAILTVLLGFRVVMALRADRVQRDPTVPGRRPSLAGRPTSCTSSGAGTLSGGP